MRRVRIRRPEPMNRTFGKGMLFDWLKSICTSTNRSRCVQVCAFLLV